MSGAVLLADIHQNELRSAYNVSPLISGGTNGSGQTVALFELDGYSGAAGSGEGEVELDIEVINAIAPKANVVVYEGPNSNQGVIDTYQKIATDDMASQGQSIFAASGDSGAYDGGGTSSQLIANGGLENGSSPWIESSAGGNS